jgi:hypothetical protein
VKSSANGSALRWSDTLTKLSRLGAITCTGTAVRRIAGAAIVSAMLAR